MIRHISTSGMPGKDWALAREEAQLNPIAPLE
jgi:hypothetical protein